MLLKRNKIGSIPSDPLMIQVNSAEELVNGMSSLQLYGSIQDFNECYENTKNSRSLILNCMEFIAFNSQNFRLDFNRNPSQDIPILFEYVDTEPDLIKSTKMLTNSQRSVRTEKNSMEASVISLN